MSDQNPYSTPDASLASETIDTYNPKFFSPRGRIGRLRYLAYLSGTFFLLLAIAGPIAVGSRFLAQDTNLSIVVIIFRAVLSLLFFMLVLGFTQRRLHDLNRSGLWVLLFFLPLVNFILLICIVFFRGTEGSNDYGLAPGENTLAIKILAFIFPTIFVAGMLASFAVPRYQDYVTRAQQSQ